MAVKVALIGAGKMGISHLSILGANPNVDVVGVCDTSKLVLGALQKYTKFQCFTNHIKMLDEAKPDAVVIAVPTKFHFEFAKEVISRNIHVFVEKPFCLNPTQSSELVAMAKSNNVVNQVGYHNKFVGTFQEVKRLVADGYIGTLQHFEGEAYGPVVIKKKADTWRSDPTEGGGCLMDYASHVIDLINDTLSPIAEANGTILKTIYSSQVDDSVFSLLQLNNGTSGLLSVNWSDETYRKMSTSMTILGSKGKIISDANELKVYFKDDNCPKGYSKGWNVKYVTDLAGQVDFYLRGEEYSAQMDYFIQAVLGNLPNSINNFESAWVTDKAIALIKKSAKS